MTQHQRQSAHVNMCAYSTSVIYGQASCCCKSLNGIRDLRFKILLPCGRCGPKVAESELATLTTRDLFSTIFFFF